MKKTYVAPTLTKRANLAAVTAASSSTVVAA